MSVDATMPRATVPAILPGSGGMRGALSDLFWRRPQLLLVDDPTSALDPATRDDVLAELVAEVHAVGIPTWAVSHDPALAAMADRLVLMHGRRIVQTGRPLDVHAQPASGAVARLLGLRNVFRGRLTGTAGSQHLIWPEAGVSLPVKTTLADGTAVDWHIAPEAIRLQHGGTVPAGTIMAGVELPQRSAYGQYAGLRCGQARLWADLSSCHAAETVRLSLPWSSIRCWPA